MAMAASKKTAARGNVIWETAKNELCRYGVARAQRVSRYRPKPQTTPENAHVIIPGMIPVDAIA
jgi:hypothetical protein